MTTIAESLREKGKILSIYFTAGYPRLKDTVPILKELESQGVDMVEIGLPFSDPLADGPVIQASSTAALQNGMTTEELFRQLKDIRRHVSIPLVIMGYFNPVYQFGVEAFCERCARIGINGLILPDLPLDIYRSAYAEIFKKYDLSLNFLITPRTPVSRIREIDAVSKGFIYLVSTASTTGKTEGISAETKAYFKRVAAMGLRNPIIAGFGIHDRDSFLEATAYTDGAIIGSAFIRKLSAEGLEGIADFIKRIR